MGQFSFTDATDPSRSIVLSGGEHPDNERTAYLLLPGGGKIEEPAYDGYGHFGGMDAYEWLAEANGLLGGREEAIKVFFSEEGDDHYKPLVFPLRITYDPEAVYENVGDSLSCPHQGLPPRPDKAIALDAGVDPSAMDGEDKDDLDFSDPNVILAAKLMTVFVTHIPNLGNIDYDKLEDPDVHKNLLNIVQDSPDFKKLKSESDTLPSPEALESYVAMIIYDFFYNGEYLSRNALDEAVIHINAITPPTESLESDGLNNDEHSPSPRR